MDPNEDRWSNARYIRMHLFLLRVWNEPQTDGTPEWHGKLQRVVSGENKAFHGLDGLAELLESFLPSKAPPNSVNKQPHNDSIDLGGEQ